jgi:hypothetical protein
MRTGHSKTVNTHETDKWSFTAKMKSSTTVINLNIYPLQLSTPFSCHEKFVHLKEAWSSSLHHGSDMKEVHGIV